VAGVIELTETGVLDVAERFDVLAWKATSRDLILTASPVIRAAFQRLFDTKGEGVWKATSEKATDEKRAKGLLTEPMRASDRLYQSLLNAAAGKTGKGAVRRVRKKNTEMLITSKWPELEFQARRGRLATYVDDRGRQEVVQAIRDALLS
jgi:hypothetical protein